MPPPIAPADVHFNEDIRLIMRSILATHESTRRMQPHNDAMEHYDQGFKTAIVLIAESLNVHLGIAMPHHYLDR